MQTNWAFRGRKGLTIDKNWGLLPDPMGRCRAQSWWKKERQPGRFFPSYDGDAFWATTVPGSFVRLHPQLEYYEGEAVYRVYFEFPRMAPGARAFIHFENICDRASIYLNGKMVGEFDGPHQTHSEDITAYGKPVVIAEIGIDAVLGEQGFDYGEARQAEYYRKTMNLFHEAVAEGILQGLIPFTLSDFKTPIKLGRFQAGYNRKGIQTVDGKPKMAYRIVKDGYRAEKCQAEK